MTDSLRYLNIKVVPRSSRQQIIKLDLHHYKIRLISAPEKGKANQELISLLADHFDVSPWRISIVNGHTSSQKLIKIDINKDKLNT